MLSITRKTDYALVAIVHLARAYPVAVNTREIAHERHIPQPVLQKILTSLAHADLVISAKGPKGGYTLSRKPDAIALIDVINAIEGSFCLTYCAGTTRNRSDKPCGTHAACPIVRPIRKVHGLLEQCLSKVNIAQMANDTVPDLASLVGATARKKRKTTRKPETKDVAS